MLIEAGMIIMQQTAWPGSIGDSCAETSRAIVLDKDGLSTAAFSTEKGYLRHPSAPEGWRESDMSNDQLLPLMLVDASVKPGWPFIKGTRTLLSLGSMLIQWQQWKLLNLINIVQGWLLPGSDKDESADYLNYVIIYIWLRDNGHWATLNIPVDTVLKKVEDYYRPEPNAWVVDLYKQKLKQGEGRDEDGNIRR